MALGYGRAPGKVILFGEHAVVYGRPALAVPVTQVYAEAIVEDGDPHTGLTVWAQDTGEQLALVSAPAEHPLVVACRAALECLELAHPGPDWHVIVRSTIPIASGMGSGAAVTTAIVRALSTARGRPLAPAAVSALVYEVEKLHHGTPSGIDNTVIAYGQPVYFVRGQPSAPFAIPRPFALVIADTGIRSPTKIAVGDVRHAWEREPARYEALFDQIAAIVEAARTAIAGGQPEKLGLLMDANHRLLQQIGVSCRELDGLVDVARRAGASGAKLSGAGRGGNIIALVEPAKAGDVMAALHDAGAARTILTTVGS